MAENDGDFDASPKVCGRTDWTEACGATVRELLAKVGQKRRGYLVVRRIEQGLAKAQLRTEPSFTQGWIDAQIRLLPARLRRCTTRPVMTRMPVSALKCRLSPQRTVRSYLCRDRARWSWLFP